MQDPVEPGALVDGYRVGESIHRGGQGAIYLTEAPAGADPGFPLVMKVPRLGRGESTLGVESFEIEQMILPRLGGPHVPRFVATGDITAVPYIVMERIEGVSLAKLVERARAVRADFQLSDANGPTVAEICRKYPQVAAVNFANEGYQYSVFDNYNGEEKPSISEQGVKITPPGKGREVTYVCQGKAKADYTSLQDALPSEP